MSEKLWNIESLSTIRDDDTKVIHYIESLSTIRGGTKVIHLRKEPHYKYASFYIHKDNWTIHTEYPVSDDNILKDEQTRVYILDRLERYKKDCELRLEEANRFIDNLNQTDE